MERMLLASGHGHRWLFLYASYYGTDQTQTQRLLSSKNLDTIKKLIFSNAFFVSQLL